MLNYIWLALIVIGIGVAVYSDVHDISSDKYGNNKAVKIGLALGPEFRPQRSSDTREAHPCSIFVAPSDFNAVYGTTLAETVAQRAEIIPILERDEILLGVTKDSTWHWSGTGTVHIFVDNRTPPIWKEIANLQKDPGVLTVHYYRGMSHSRPEIILEPIRFVKLNAVTNDGIIKYAKTAVELAIGLIGIMALWLGLMKIAEQAGLVAKLAAVLKPVTTRLFPDVPADHPAMGAMIMNISANMLGLNNAATPLGLKAMEELNKLNKKVGTATDAMVTFLVINTSNLQIIPASVIAIRAASGSSNPAEIIGAVIVASALTMVIAIVTVKLMAKLPSYRKQLTSTED